MTRCQAATISYMDFRGGGEGRVRTSVGVRRQIYSLLPLATREPLHISYSTSQDYLPEEAAINNTRKKEMQPLFATFFYLKLAMGVEPATC